MLLCVLGCIEVDRSVATTLLSPSFDFAHHDYFQQSPTKRKMGVTGLWELVNRAGKKCELSGLANRRVAVDTSIWLTQFVRGMRAEDGGPLENAHLRGLFTRVCKLLYFGVKPVFVFDGGKPALKQNTLIARAAARHKMQKTSDALAREQLIQRLKKRTLTMQDADGRPLDEAAVRQLLATVDVQAAAQNGAEEESLAPRALPPLKSHPPRISRTRLAEMEERSQLDAKLRDLESMSRQLPTQESGLMLSHFQLDNLVGSLQKRDRGSNVVEGAIASEPDRRFLFLKGDDIGGIPEPPKKAKVEAENLFFVNDDFLGDSGLGDEYEFEDEEEQKEENKVVEKGPVAGESGGAFLMLDDSKIQSVGDKLGERSEPFIGAMNEQEEDGDDDKEIVDESVAVVERKTQFQVERQHFVHQPSPSKKLKVDGIEAMEQEQTVANNLGMEFSDQSDSVADEEEDDSHSSVHAGGEDQMEESSLEEDLSVLEMDRGDASLPTEIAIVSSEEDPSVFWECSLCSYHNSFESSSCQVCHGLRQRGGAAGSAQPAIAAAHSANFVDPMDPSASLGQVTDPFAAISAVANESPHPMSGPMQVIRADIEARERQLAAQSNAQERMMEGVDSLMIQESKDLMSLFGVPWVDAPMEAEAQCGTLEELGLVDGVVTEDSDVFLVGARNVYKNLFRSAYHPQKYRMVDAEATLGMNRFNFIQLAYFLGSDYTVGVKGVGLVLAVEILSEFKADGGSESEAESLGGDEELELDECLQPLATFRDWFKDHSSSRAKGLRKRLAKVILPASFPDREVARGYLRPEVDKSQVEFSWSSPKWESLRAFAIETIKWSPEKVDSILDPISERLKELDASGKIPQKTMLEFFSVQAEDIPLQVTSQRLAKAIARFKGEKFVAPEKPKSEKKRTRTKAKKPTKAKRSKKAKSAYSFFMVEKSKELRDANPEMPFAEVSKACGAQWKLQEDRSKYMKLAKDDKERVQRELEEEDELEIANLDDEKDKDDDDDDVVLFDDSEEAQKGHSKEPEAPEERNMDDGPPFEREELASLKMNKLRALCHRYNLKPAVRKADVVSQLCMLSKTHQPVSTAVYQKNLGRGGKKLEREEAMDDWDFALDQMQSGE